MHGGLSARRCLCKVLSGPALTAAWRASCAVGDLDVNGDFVVLGAEGSGGETSAIDPLDAGDGGLDQEASAVSVSSLPGHSPARSDLRGMPRVGTVRLPMFVDTSAT